MADGMRLADAVRYPQAPLFKSEDGPNKSTFFSGNVARNRRHSGLAIDGRISHLIKVATARPRSDPITISIVGHFEK